MKKIIFILSLCALVFPCSLYAQLEKVIVETYYISDDLDATDTTGGYLEPGSTTYRIYIDMAPGYKLYEIYGDINHALKISSTANFFNNIDNDQPFGYLFHKNRYGYNTVALDTWLTLGQTTTAAAKTYFGTLKTEDRDGSFIGGVNNDGGSLPVDSGLLRNNDSAAGIPLTTSDGMDTIGSIPTNWNSSGDLDLITGNVDSTIFSSYIPGNQFISNNAYLRNSGVTGVNRDSNQVLVAQLTTKGDISFELNVILLDSTGKSIYYVAKFANGESNNDTLKISPYLTYPLPCGCKDPKYLEYSSAYGCDNPDSCKTLVVLGCMDKTACNYDPNTNFNIQSLCCYPGYCNDRDIAVVCPSLSINRNRGASELTLYPNPAQNEITVQIPDVNDLESKYEIYDSFGRLIMVKDLGVVSGSINEQLDISKLASGLYMFRLFVGDSSNIKTFIKN